MPQNNIPSSSLAKTQNKDKCNNVFFFIMWLLWNASCVTMLLHSKFLKMSLGVSFISSLVIMILYCISHKKNIKKTWFYNITLLTVLCVTYSVLFVFLALESPLFFYLGMKTAILNYIGFRSLNLGHAEFSVQ